MKKLLSSIALGFTGLVSFASSPFEGQLTYQVDSNGRKTDVAFIVKGNKMAIESPANPQGSVIIDRESMKALALIPQQKMYMELPAQKFIENAGQEPTGTFEVTDETKKILDYDARKVVYTDGSETTILWITDELG